MKHNSNDGNAEVSRVTLAERPFAFSVRITGDVGLSSQSQDKTERSPAVRDPTRCTSSNERPGAVSQFVLPRHYYQDEQNIEA